MMFSKSDVFPLYVIGFHYTDIHFFFILWEDNVKWILQKQDNSVCGLHSCGIG